MDDLIINLTKTVSAPIERVFNAWLDADTLSRFMTPMPGMPEPRVDAEGKEGGHFTIYMQVGDDVIPHSGEYLEVIPYDKLVFSWVSPFSTDGSTVTLHFKSLDAQHTEIEFSHVKFKGEQERSNHEGGWTHILQRLDEILETVT